MGPTTHRHVRGCRNILALQRLTNNLVDLKDLLILGEVLIDGWVENRLPANSEVVKSFKRSTSFLVLVILDSLLAPQCKEIRVNADDFLRIETSDSCRQPKLK